MLAIRSAWAGSWDGLRWVFAVVGIGFVGSVAWSLLGAGLSPLGLGLAFVELGVFAAIVLEAILRDRRRILPTRGMPGVVLVAVMTAAAVALVVVQHDSVGAAGFYFAGIAAGRLRPDRLAVRAIAVLSAVTILCIAPFSRDPIGATAEGVAVGILSLTVYGIRVLQRTNRELVLARNELARLAVADERLRISRDLHDTLGHSLSLIALKSELAGRLLPDDPARARAEIADVEQVAREALAAVRETVSGYRRPTLDAELASARRMLEAAGIAGDVEGDAARVDAVAESVLAWAVREGVTNVIRHSGASHCRVTVTTSDGAVVAEVVDDGSGDRSGRGGITTSSSSSPGSGLTGLAERVSACGGRLQAAPRPEGGFRLRVSVPLAA